MKLGNAVLGSMMVASCAQGTVTSDGGAIANRVADMLNSLRDGNKQPCLEMTRGVRMTMGDMIGPASSICGDNGLKVSSVSQSIELDGVVVTLAERVEKANKFENLARYTLLFKSGKLAGSSVVGAGGLRVPKKNVQPSRNFEELKSIAVTTTVADLKKQGLVEVDGLIDAGGACDSRGCYSTAETVGYYYGEKSNPSLKTEIDRQWFCPVPVGARSSPIGMGEQWTAQEKSNWMCGKLHG